MNYSRVHIDYTTKGRLREKSSDKKKIDFINVLLILGLIIVILIFLFRK